MIVREAHPHELPAAGALRVQAYEDQDLLAAAPGYAATLRGLGADGAGTVLVAVDDAGGLLGTVMLEPWLPRSEVARTRDEAEIRALAVAPDAQGRGVGRALLRTVLDRAAASGATRLLLSTQPAMTTAQRLYASEGFARVPERDWSPFPGVTLMAYARPLAAP